MMDTKSLQKKNQRMRYYIYIYIYLKKNTMDLDLTICLCFLKFDVIGGFMLMCQWNFDFI